MFPICPASCPRVSRIWGQEWGQQVTYRKVLPPMPLKAAELRTLQPSDTPYRKSDGKGLYLEI